LIGPNGQVKLADLGFSAYLESAAEMRDITAASLTPGACQFLPPEQFASGKEVDFRGDLYSLGVTLFVLLTGKLPFKPASPVEMLMDKALNRFPSARQVNPLVSDATSRLIRWLMQADPPQRPPSADSFIRAAKECLTRLSTCSDANLADEPTEQGPIVVSKKTRSHKKPTTPRSGFRHQMALGLGVLFVATLAGLLLVNVW
jgi:serine/threonine protein kinase